MLATLLRRGHFITLDGSSMEQMGKLGVGKTHQSLLESLWSFVFLSWLGIKTGLDVNSKAIWITPCSEWFDRVEGYQWLVIVEDDI